MSNRINRTSSFVRLLKVFSTLRICPLIRLFSLIDELWTYIFPRSASTPSRCGWCPYLSIWPFSMFLLHVSIESWIAQIGLITVLAFIVSTIYIVLWSTFLHLVIFIFLILRVFITLRFETWKTLITTCHSLRLQYQMIRWMLFLILSH